MSASIKLIVVACIILLSNCNIDMNLLLLGNSDSGISCFMDSLNKYIHKLNHISPIYVKDKNIKAGNKEAFLFYIYKVFKINSFLNKDFPDLIFYFYSLEEGDDNNLLEEMKSIDTFLRYAGVEIQSENEYFFIIANKRMRLVRGKEKLLKSVSETHKVKYIHLKAECEEEFDKEFKHFLENATKRNIDSNKNDGIKINNLIEFIDSQKDNKNMIEILEIYKNRNKMDNLPEISIQILLFNAVFIILLMIPALTYFYLKRIIKKNEIKTYKRESEICQKDTSDDNLDNNIKENESKEGQPNIIKEDIQLASVIEGNNEEQIEDNFCIIEKICNTKEVSKNTEDDKESKEKKEDIDKVDDNQSQDFNLIK